MPAKNVSQYYVCYRGKTIYFEKKIDAHDLYTYISRNYDHDFHSFGVEYDDGSTRVYEFQESSPF